jgi:hypothetical protein
MPAALHIGDLNANPAIVLDNSGGTSIGCKLVSLDAKSAYHLLVDEYKEANK